MKRIAFGLMLTMMIAGAAYGGTLCGSTVNSTGVHGADVNLLVASSGCLTSSDAGVTAGGAWNPANNGFFDVTWSVSQNGSEFTYLYNFLTTSVGGGLGGGLSHWILELSAGCTFANGCLISTDPSTGIEVNNHEGPSPGNPTMPHDIYGIKIDTGGVNSISIEIVSDRVPVYQNFYAKDGPDATFAYNAGFNLVGVSSFYIPGPDTRPLEEIPEPGFYVSLAAGMLAILYTTYRRRRMTA